jgi:hypothetical protein
MVRLRVEQGNKYLALVHLVGEERLTVSAKAATGLIFCRRAQNPAAAVQGKLGGFKQRDFRLCLLLKRRARACAPTGRDPGNAGVPGNQVELGLLRVHAR